MSTMLYYTAWNKQPDMLAAIQGRHSEQAERLDMRFLSVGPQHCEVSFPACGMPRGPFAAIMTGLAYIEKSEIVYLCEDDVLYPEDHFAVPEMFSGQFAYNLNTVFLSVARRAFFERFDRKAGPFHLCLSNAFASCAVMRAVISAKLAQIDGGQFDGSFEPQTPFCHVGPTAIVDVRGTGNHTWRAPADTEWHDTEPGWPDAKALCSDYKLA